MADDKKSNVSIMFELALASIKLFTTNDKKISVKIRRQKSKMISRAMRDYKKLFKLMKKDGFTIEETKMLDEVLAAIAQAEINLLKSEV